MSRVWAFIRHNRYTVILPLLALGLWLYAGGCVAVTSNPINEIQQVNARELQVEYESWVKQCEIIQLRFEAAGRDLTEQYNAQSRFLNFIVQLSAGAAPDLPGLLKLLVGAGILGLGGDNARKSGVIGVMKKKAVQNVS